MKKTQKNEEVNQEKTQDLGFPGMNQVVTSKEKVQKTLAQLLTTEDYYELKKNKHRLVIAKHDAVKKIADFAGISTEVGYQILISPDPRNNNTVAMMVTISDGMKITTEVGEVNRGNLGTRGRQNPVNMAQKRAYDRAVFRHLGITGILSEDELPDEEEIKHDMDHLTEEEQKAIVPLINEIINAKTLEDVTKFNLKMKEEAKNYNDKQLKVLRNLRDKSENKLKTQSF